MNLLSESFKQKYEQFLTGCDAIEQEGRWNVEEYGEMETFYTGDLVSVILRLIVTDGAVSEREASVLNELFGFDYTAEELAQVYAVCEENLGADFDRLFSMGVDTLEKINAALAEAYKQLLLLICAIVSESDGLVTATEQAEVERLKRLCT
jgi:hypothetical protein